MLNNILERFKFSNLFYEKQLANHCYSQTEVVPNIVRITQMRNVQNEALKLFERKNRDYGDSFARYGSIGVLMRLGDKISRLQSITKNGVVLVNDEQVRDTLIDLHNYSAMAVMLLDEGKELTIEQDTYNEFDCDIEEFNNSYKHHTFFGFIMVSVGLVAFRFYLYKE